MTTMTTMKSPSPVVLPKGRADDDDDDDDDVKSPSPSFRQKVQV
jgi:hypothetical protein